MFSAMTMPSSTKIPITRIIPNKLMTLIVTPAMPAKMNIPANDTGMAKATQNANRMFKNNASKITTSRKPNTPLLTSKSIRWFSTTELSRITSRCRPVPTSAACALYASM